jgi:hypothetical protein
MGAYPLRVRAALIPGGRFVLDGEKGAVFGALSSAWPRSSAIFPMLGSPGSAQVITRRMRITTAAG